MAIEMDTMEDQHHHEMTELKVNSDKQLQNLNDTIYHYVEEINAKNANIMETTSLNNGFKSLVESIRRQIDEFFDKLNRNSVQKLVIGDVVSVDSDSETGGGNYDAIEAEQPQENGSMEKVQPNDDLEVQIGHEQAENEPNTSNNINDESVDPNEEMKENVPPQSTPIAKVEPSVANVTDTGDGVDIVVATVVSTAVSENVVPENKPSTASTITVASNTSQSKLSKVDKKKNRQKKIVKLVKKLFVCPLCDDVFTKEPKFWVHFKSHKPGRFVKRKHQAIETDDDDNNTNDDDDDDDETDDGHFEPQRPMVKRKKIASM
ncbi:uncharacterized protein LOC116349164 isoform X2 [Contarinia nasturtii]|nr:uncharacterized protein LOC116349164 isoform X2 [Contarinia nasturtii]